MDLGSSPGLASLCGHRQVIYPPEPQFSHGQIEHDLIGLATEAKHVKMPKKLWVPGT